MHGSQNIISQVRQEEKCVNLAVIVIRQLLLRRQPVQDQVNQAGNLGRNGTMRPVLGTAVKRRQNGEDY